MATFELIEDATYRITGTITQEDIEKINSFSTRTILVLQNTVGQSSDTISKINSKNVVFSVLGGLDYFKKDKYNNSGYIERTYSNPQGLTEILCYFESIEAEINPNWTDTQRCMYIHNALATDMEYVKHLPQDVVEDGVTERSLNGILYGQLTCAGLAKAYKEMLDRQNIQCIYQNQRSVHAFNVVELEGKMRGVDVTWDCTKKSNEKCSFKNFGLDPNFYMKHGHRIQKDEQEQVYDLTPFEEKKLLQDYEVIKTAIEQRKSYIPFFQNDRGKKKGRFLPVDNFMKELQEEQSAIIKIRLLQKMGVDIQGADEATRERYGFISDYIGTNRGKNTLDLTLSDITKRVGFQGYLISKNWEPILVTIENGKRKESDLSQEQKDILIPLLYGEVKEYYTKAFMHDASRVDELKKMYEALQNEAPENKAKIATISAHLYSKIKFLANGKEFFDTLGVSEDNQITEIVSEKSQNCLEINKEKHLDEKSQHEYDLDFLYAVIQNDILNINQAGRCYTQEDLLRLVQDVRQGSEFDSTISDDEIKTLYDEATSRNMTSEDICRGTVDSGVGMNDVRDVIREMSRDNSKDKSKDNNVKEF